MTGEIRIGDAEREQAAAVLADHYAAGRLDHDEYAERLDAIWTARTRGDLDVIFHDLPRLAPPPPPVRARGRGRWPFPVVAFMVLVVGALVLTHLPVFLLLIGVVLVFKIGRHHSGHGRWRGGVRR
jgi:uncharacterized membrane protein